MTDGRDPEDEELRALIADLESTLVELRGELDDGRRDGPRVPRGLPGGGRRAPRPPRLREVVRFTESYTIPALISVLETNIRLLRLGAAALRALDPERSTIQSDDDGDGAVGHALDAGRGLSTDRLASGLDELNDALAGTDAPDPEARELLADAEELSAEIQDRLRGARDERTERRASDDEAGEPDDAVHIDVADGRTEESDDEPPAPDVDAELDSIREEVRGTTGAEAAEDETRENGHDAEDDDGEDGDSEDGDGTAPE